MLRLLLGLSLALTPLLAWASSDAGNTGPQPPRRSTPPPRNSANEARLMLDLARYMPKIYNKIHKLWSVKGIPLMELHRRSMTVRLWIKPDGKLRRIRVVISSSLKKFDDSVLAAVSRSIPFARPPASLRSYVAQKGIEFLFRRQVFRKRKLPLKTKFKHKMRLYDWQKRNKARKKTRRTPPRRRPKARPKAR